MTAPNKLNKLRNPSILSGLTLMAITSLLITGCGANSGKTTETVSALSSNASPYQKEILLDGYVDYAEYEKSILASRNCVQEAGAVASEVKKTGNNELTFDYEVEAKSREELDEINVRAEACGAEYSTLVGQVWASQQLISTEERDALQGEVVSCLESQGIKVPTEADFNEVTELAGQDVNAEAAQICAEKYPQYFSVAASEDHE